MKEMNQIWLLEFGVCLKLEHARLLTNRSFAMQVWSSKIPDIDSLTAGMLLQRRMMLMILLMILAAYGLVKLTQILKQNLQGLIL
jgi:hypothetical protein